MTNMVFQKKVTHPTFIDDGKYCHLLANNGIEIYDKRNLTHGCDQVSRSLIGQMQLREVERDGTVLAFLAGAI